MHVEGVIQSQYAASLRMLRSAIEACPAHLWDDASYKNRFWLLAYHVLFYAHLYLGRSEDSFIPWEKQRADYHFLDRFPWPPHSRVEIGEPYSRAEILEYWALVASGVARQADEVPMDGPSGFSWLPFNRLELHVYNIRHIQHHAAQMIDRIGKATGAGVDWVRMVTDDEGELW